MINLELIDIQEIINSLEEINFDYELLLNDIDGDIQRLPLEENHLKIIVRKISSKINTVVIDCQFNKMTSIFFNGQIGITLSDIRKITTDIEETHSIHDGLFFYSFKIKKGPRIYLFSFYEPSGSRIDMAENHFLTNLGVSWE